MYFTSAFSVVLRNWHVREKRPVWLRESNTSMRVSARSDSNDCLKHQMKIKKLTKHPVHIEIKHCNCMGSWYSSCKCLHKYSVYKYSVVHPIPGLVPSWYHPTNQNYDDSWTTVVLVMQQSLCNILRNLLTWLLF